MGWCRERHYRIIVSPTATLMVTQMLEDYITLPINEFCRLTGIGQTFCRQMIADGRLRSVRVGSKKILVDVSSWREYIERQAASGVPEYTGTKRAIEVRKAKLADVLREQGLLR